MRKTRYFIFGEGCQSIETYGFESFLDYISIGLMVKGEHYETLKATKATTPEYILGAFEGYASWARISEQEYMAIKQVESC